VPGIEPLIDASLEAQKAEPSPDEPTGELE
jgi:hypothetical protein